MSAFPRTTPAKILVVDDEADIVESTARIIAAHLPAVQVLTAHSGAQGLELLERTNVDIILSDYAMPEMDGIAFLKESQQMQPDVHRVMMTAFQAAAEARRAVQEAHLEELLEKPVAPAELLALIDRLLEERASFCPEA